MTLDIQGAADFLKVSETTLQEMAARGEVPGARIGRAWVFSVTLLEKYLHEQIERQTGERIKAQRTNRMADARQTNRVRKRPPRPPVSRLESELSKIINYKEGPTK